MKRSVFFNVIWFVLITLSCDPEKVITVIDLYPPKIEYFLFKKNTVDLKWTIQKTEEEILGYKVSYKAVGSEESGQTLVSASALSDGYELPGLLEGQKYQVKVQPVYGNYFGEWSNVVEGVVGKPETVKGFALVKNTRNKNWFLELEWNKNEINDQKRLTIASYDVTCFGEGSKNKHVFSIAAGGQSSYEGRTDSANLKLDPGRYLCEVFARTNTGIKSDGVSARVEVARIEEPAFSALSVEWGTVISFPRSYEHTYTLASNTSSVVTCEGCGNSTTSEIKISATEFAAGIVVNVERAGYNKIVRSKEITFLKQAGPVIKPALSSTAVEWGPKNDITFTLQKNHEYVLKNGNSRGATLAFDRTSTRTPNIGRITATQGVRNVVVVATWKEDNKYLAARVESEAIEFRKQVGPVIQPVLGLQSAEWGTPITFALQDGHTYELNNTDTKIVKLDLDRGKKLGTITATQGVENLVVIAMCPEDEKYIEKKAYSNKIRFTKKPRLAATIKPVLSSQLEVWGTTPITFAAEHDHDYSLGGNSNGVTLNFDTNRRTGTIAATQVAKNVIVVATRRADNKYFAGASESAMLEFTEKVRVVTAGREYTVGIQEDGTLWSWGANYSGQLGRGGKTESPKEVKKNTKWKMVVAGREYTVAIKADGTLWSWGGNGYGQLGLGHTNDRKTPQQVGNAKNWKAIAAGQGHTVAIQADGTLWSWGSNGYGQLGLGGTTDRKSPQQVGNGTKWKSVVAGSGHTVAIKADGTLWSWGSNGYGQLGLGGTTDRKSPQQVGNGTKWKAIAAGQGHTIAIKKDGTLWSWGNNHVHQLGRTVNKTYPQEKPGKVKHGTKWKEAAADILHTVGIQEDGTLWSWGSNYIGQLGLGSTVSTQNTPRQVSSDVWKAVTTGGFHTIAIKEDGTLWSWGNYNDGQLGRTDRVNTYNEPGQVKF